MKKFSILLLWLVLFPTLSFAAGMIPGVGEDMNCTSVGQVLKYMGTGDGEDFTDWSCKETPISTYNSNGTATSDGHMVIGTTTLSSGSVTVNFSGDSVFSSTNSYVCQGNDTSGSVFAVSAVNQSASSVRFFGTLNNSINYICTGN